MEKNNIVDLKIDPDKPPKRVFIRNNKKPEYTDCQHCHLLLDHATNAVYCADCGEKLDPMWVLSRIADKHNSLYFSYRDLYAKAQRAAKMNRCKCEHCGKMTKIIKDW